jgi:Zn-dependent peptidase ImmA (M78 family)/DNA-binding XRE family transcriptional regulator
MKQFPERLKNARKMNGLSLQDLSDGLDGILSKQALSRLETGEQSPDSDTLSKLCSALNVTLDYFFKDAAVELGQVEFRKLKKLPVKEQERVVSTTKEYLERYLELENLLGITDRTSFALRSYPISDMEDIPGAVREMRTILKAGDDPIYNCVELLEEHNIKVYRVIADPSFSGMSTIVGNEVSVIVFNDHDNIPLVRKRFTILHELAHLYLRLDGFEEKQCERFCDAFAGGVLLPDEKLLGYFGGKRVNVYTKELQFIKKNYGIALSAIMYRAKVLGLISESYMKYFMIRYNQNLKKSERMGYVGREESDRFMQLLIRGIAQEIISTTKAAALNNMTLGEFRERYLDANA